MKLFDLLKVGMKKNKDMNTEQLVSEQLWNTIHNGMFCSVGEEIS